MHMLKRYILWEYPRGSWQYDIIVGVILAFLFLTPRAWFRDQPRIPHVSVISIPRGTFAVDPEFWTAIPEGQRIEKVTQEIRSRAGNPHLTVIGVEPYKDSEGETRCYIAFTK